MRSRALLAAALIALLSRAASSSDVEKRRGTLDYGLWNGRVQALYDLGEEGKDALPLLIYSSDDADWQIRLTAVHFMGKIGPAAAPALGDIVRVEPCPYVRVSALRWLAGMGPAAAEVLRGVMTPEDAREMEVIPDRYGTERMGKPLVIDAPGGSMTAEFFDRGLDLRVCASSEYANRRKRGRPAETGDSFAVAEAPAAAGDEASSADSFEPVSTPPVRLAKPPAPSEPERLPDSPPEGPVALIEAEIPVPAATTRSPETLPRAGPGFEPREAPVPRDLPA